MNAPRLSQLPFEAVLAGGIGYGLGRLAHVNAKLSATVLVIASIARWALFEVAHRVDICQHYEISPDALGVASQALVSSVTLLAAHHLNLIGGRVLAVSSLALTLLVLARISLLNEKSPCVVC